MISHKLTKYCPICTNVIEWQNGRRNKTCSMACRVIDRTEMWRKLVVKRRKVKNEVQL